MNNYLKLIARRFHRNQKGAALTEFILFLPIWITVFIGVINLGKLGIESTKVQMIAQNKMWAMAVDTSTSGLDSEWAFPSTGGANAASTSADLGRGIGDGFEAVASGFQAAEGHWGESFSKTLPISLVTNSVDDLTENPKDIIGDAEYPDSIVNDNAARSVMSMSGGGVKTILTKLVSGSGLTVSFGAGIRYGMAHGRHTESISLLRGTSFAPDFHYDVIAAPSPVENGFQTFAVARLMAELDSSDNYSVMMNFGESEWEGNGSSSGENDLGIPTDWGDKIDKNNKDSEDKQKEAEDKKKECNKNPKPEGCP